MGNGAATWAASHGIELVDPNTMLTTSTRKCYSVYRRKIDDAQPERRACTSLSTSTSTGVRSTDAEAEPPARKAREQELKLDTVGVLCMDTSGECCAALSSGGVQLKHAGRLGHAPLFGCGCWAQRYVSPPYLRTDHSLDQCDGTPQRCNACECDSAAVITSGCGEYLARIVFAKSCADFCCRPTAASADDPELSRNVRCFFEQDFMRSPYLASEQRLAGVVCARWSPRRSACKLWKLSFSFLETNV